MNLLWAAGLALGILTAAPAMAQSAKGTATDTVYYSATAERMPSRVGAARGIVTKPTATGGTVQSIYDAAGHRLEQIPYSDQAGKVREGIAWSWYPTGELKGRRAYHNGELDGQLSAYYPDGTVRQVELYEKGNSKTRLCFTPTGAPTTCEALKDGSREYARYRRGQLLLEEEVSRAVSPLPLPPGSTGERVIVACIVGVDGQVHETRIYKSVGATYDREALRVVNNLRHGWMPALESKEPVESYFMVNVDFLPRR